MFINFIHLNYKKIKFNNCPIFCVYLLYNTKHLNEVYQHMDFYNNYDFLIRVFWHVSTIFHNLFPSIYANMKNHTNPIYSSILCKDVFLNIFLLHIFLESYVKNDGVPIVHQFDKYILLL